MNNIIVVGAGQLGSRHLQALKNIKQTLNIWVVDPSVQSLNVAKERYEGLTVAGGTVHNVEYNESMPMGKKFDIAIVATNSDTRRTVIEDLIKNNKVNYIVLEKLLFNKKDDYNFVSNLLKNSDTKAWVNCSMRKMPFYNEIKKYLGNEKDIFYLVTGSQYGLVTNSVHYIDHIAYLSDCRDYQVGTNYLEKQPVKSKRKGFLELNGTLEVNFKNGSHGTMICYPTGNMPVQVEIHSKNFRCISREHEGKAWVAFADQDWKWQEVDAKVPYQSQMTTEIVQELLGKGTCPLVTLEESTKIHLTLLDSLNGFLNTNSSQKYDYYPFT